jgi:hypothetical protein
MQHIIGISSTSAFSSLEDTISPDNQVRFIDAFVESIDLSKLGFAVKRSRPKVARVSIVKFLKIYLYGYLNELEVVEI